jgi:hypothetical protein
VKSWYERWNINIKEGKTQVIYFSRRIGVPEDVLQLNGRNMTFVNNVKYCDAFGSSQGRVRHLQVVLTPTRRVSWYPRRVIKGSGFLADYSLVVTCLGS